MDEAVDSRGASSPGDYALLIRAIFLVAAIRAGLVLTSFRRVSETLEKRVNGDRPASSSGTENSGEEVRRLVWAVSRATRVIPTDKPCLSQALALRYMMARREMETELVIGVAKNEDKTLRAHAWVEMEGTILIGGGSSRKRYTPLASPDQYNG